MMSMARGNSVGALPDPLSMIVRPMSVEAKAISLGAETRLAVGSVNVEVVTGTSGTITVVTFETTTARTNFTVLVQLLKFKVDCHLHQCLPQVLPLEPTQYSLQS